MRQPAESQKPQDHRLGRDEEITAVSYRIATLESKRESTPRVRRANLGFKKVQSRASSAASAFAAASLFKHLGLLFLLPGERSIKGLQFCVCGFGRRVNTRVCVVYLSSHCLICIFHHVKQIEDNEGLGDEGRSCAPHTERSICFQCNTKGLLSEKPSLAMH